MDSDMGGKYTKLIKSWISNIMFGQTEHEWGVVIKEREE